MCIRDRAHPVQPPVHPVHPPVHPVHPLQLQLRTDTLQPEVTAGPPAGWTSQIHGDLTACLSPGCGAFSGLGSRQEGEQKHGQIFSKHWSGLSVAGEETDCSSLVVNVFCICGPSLCWCPGRATSWQLMGLTLHQRNTSSTVIIRIHKTINTQNTHFLQWELALLIGGIQCMFMRKFHFAV